MTPAHPFAVALGSNRGPRESHLRTAVEKIFSHPGCRRLRLSPLYRTQPVGMESDEEFLNAVGLGETTMSAEALLSHFVRIERETGRAGPREKTGLRWTDRELDLDLLFFGRALCRTPNLELPHPRLAERRFVLAPLRDVCPLWTHPVTGHGVEEMLAALPPTPWVRLEKENWC